MKNTMTETNLSITDFTRYFEAKRLGRLYFPNGKYVKYTLELSNLFVYLTDLYKLMSGWKVNHTLVPLDDIIAVIAFGSAIRYPGVEEISYARKKYLVFGPRIPGVYRRNIQPKDADFLVITGHDLMREQILEPVAEETYDSGTWLKRGGIHLVNRGANQLLRGVQVRDTVSVSALREGVPVFFNDRWGTLSAQANIASTTPRKILWDENDDGFLIGRIS